MTHLIIALPQGTYALGALIVGYGGMDKLVLALVGAVALMYMVLLLWLVLHGNHVVVYPWQLDSQQDCTYIPSKTPYYLCPRATQ